MRRWTLLEIKQKIEQDLDLEAEDFVLPDELLSMINEGIDECEAQIHKVGREDTYFLARATIDLVQGQADYTLPDNIYGNKIKALTYVQGSTIYPVRQLRGMDRYASTYVINQFSTGNDYRYMLLNESTVVGPTITLYPPSREDTADGLRLFYIRNANRLVDDADLCDIPEFVYYVIAFAKWAVLNKEGNQLEESAKAELDKQKALMMETLAEMIPDEDNMIVKDFSHYIEST